jgi:hypothetical protein
MDTTRATTLDPTTERLASEVADVRASIALVHSGVATSVTLTGLRFGQQLAQSLRKAAASQGVTLEASFWPEEDGGDLRVGIIGRAAADSPTAANPTADGAPATDD